MKFWGICARTIVRGLLALSLETNRLECRLVVDPVRNISIYIDRTAFHAQSVCDKKDWWSFLTQTIQTSNSRKKHS